jgi:hypothetical protein
VELFEEVELTWRGSKYVIKAHRVFDAIVQVEGVITVGELAGTTPRLTKLAQGYGALLRCAGAPARDEEVYAALWSDGGVNAATVAGVLLNLMVPKGVRDKLKPDEAKQE